MNRDRITPVPHSSPNLFHTDTHSNPALADRQITGASQYMLFTRLFKVQREHLPTGILSAHTESQKIPKNKSLIGTFTGGSSVLLQHCFVVVNERSPDLICINSTDTFKLIAI